MAGRGAGEAERRCLASTEPRRLPEIDRAIIAGVELQIAEGLLSLERAARYLPQSARCKAHERGERRLRDIAVAVKAEVATGELNPRAASVTGETTAEYCTSLTGQGSRCTNRAGADGLCALHTRIAEQVTTSVFVEPSIPTFASRHGPTPGALLVAMLTSPGPRRTQPRISFTSAGVRASLGRFSTRLRQAFSEALRRGAVAWKLRPHPARAGASTKWAFAASATLIGAAALIWNGLSVGTEQRPVGVVVVPDAASGWPDTADAHGHASKAPRSGSPEEGPGTAEAASAGRLAAVGTSGSPAVDREPTSAPVRHLPQVPPRSLRLPRRPPRVPSRRRTPIRHRPGDCRTQWAV